VTDLRFAVRTELPLSRRSAIVPPDEVPHTVGKIGIVQLTPATCDGAMP
jgi:hypothetical protein